MTPEDKLIFIEQQEIALESINILSTLIKKANPNQIITPQIFGSIFRQIHAVEIEDPNFEIDNKFIKL